jgi:hypothetical protein
LFYLGSDATIMAVPIEATGQLAAGLPQALFPIGAVRFNATQSYAVGKDGKRFLVNTMPRQAREAPLTVVLNWTHAIPK